MPPLASQTPREPTLARDLSRSDDELRRLFGSLRTRADVAELLEVPDRVLVSVLYLRKEPNRYRTIHIAKRKGGTREVRVPPHSLSILQAKLNRVLQAVYNPRSWVHGFARSRSIVSNAAVHAGKRWVLNVDLEEFFPSINFGRVRGVFVARPYDVGPAAATVLAQICCTENQLPQGSACSPVVSNMICGRLDGELAALARRCGAAYTRYADDITLSVRKSEFPADLATAGGSWVGGSVVIGPVLRHVIESNRFRINESKTRLQFRDCRQRVTGLTTNVFPNIPRERVRELRGMLHAWHRFGLEGAEEVFHDRFDLRHRRDGAPAPSFRNVVRGKLEFLRMVRGDRDPIYVKLRQRLHELDSSLIEPPMTPLPRRFGGLRGGAEPGWTRWFQRYQQSVFHLEIRRDDRVNSGTAFALHSGLLATAAHNLVGEVYVSISGTLTPAPTARIHQRHEAGIDCALIEIFHGARSLRLRDGLPEPGEPIAIIGFASVPLRQPTPGVYAGSVESNPTTYDGRIQLIQVSIPSVGGLSGSPVIDLEGAVIGVVIESAFEQTREGVPGREFCTVLPAAHLREIRR